MKIFCAKYFLADSNVKLRIELLKENDSGIEILKETIIKDSNNDRKGHNITWNDVTWTFHESDKSITISNIILTM